MAEEKKQGWTRTQGFRKHYASVFGLTKSGNLYRIDFGNERIQINEDDVMNLSEVQVIMDESAFELLFDLMRKHRPGKNKK